MLRFRARTLPGGLYSRLTAARRVYLHRKIGVRVEAGYGPQAGEIAAELAMHFEQGRDTRRAVTYLQQAAHNALHKYANREAIDHLTKGLALLNTLPETPERTQQELDLLLALGPAWMAVKSVGAAELEHIYTRARELCQQLGETPQIFPTLAGLARFYNNRAELLTAHALGEQLFKLAQRTQEPALVIEAHRTLGTILFWRAELTSARALLEEGLTLYHRRQPDGNASLYMQVRDPGIEMHGFNETLAHRAHGS